MKMTSHRFLISSWCLLLLQLVIIANCEWIQVPLRTHDKQFDLSVEQEIPSRIAGKLEELAISLRVDRNRTKQLDLELDHPVTVTTKTPRAEVVTKGSKTKKNNRGESTQVINKRISEPFSIFNFLRSIRDSFFKPQATVKQKIGFLERIRNNILAEISECEEEIFLQYHPVIIRFLAERRILGLFSVQRQRDGGSRRTKRDEHGGHDISSADGYPLVTICFLTFSVFLIKLVLVSAFIVALSSADESV